jgi:carboxymethylenebutenolidase
MNDARSASATSEGNNWGFHDRVAITMVDVAGTNGAIPTYFAVPNGKAPLGSVLVAHEGLGLNHHSREVAARLADEGFIAGVPDLFHRVGGPPPIGDEAAATQRVLAVRYDEAIADLDAVAHHLRTLAGPLARLGSLGFSFGARIALLHAARSSVDATFGCWPGALDQPAHGLGGGGEAAAPRVMDIVAQISHPVMVVAGVRDDRATPALIAQLIQEFASKNHTVEVKLFADAEHAFFADYRSTFQQHAADELWNDIVFFFGRHLAGNSPDPSRGISKPERPERTAP